MTAISRRWHFLEGEVGAGDRDAAVRHPPAVPAGPENLPARQASRLQGISVVIPHSGAGRRKLLATTVACLKQDPDINQIVVAEWGAEPSARDVAARWQVEYVFLESLEAFNKSRALNVGSALARHDLVVWWDNDLLLPAASLRSAIVEARQRRFDVFFPYASVVYLDEKDSAAAAIGVRDPADCRPIATLEAIRGAPGGILVNRAEFLDAHGGMCEEFRGWGGEDCAWLFKARQLGSVGVTSARGHIAYHQWHPDSGIFGGDPKQRNASYEANAALWAEIAALRSRQAVVARLPPPRYRPLPWADDVRVEFVVARHAPPVLRAAAEAWSHELRTTFGLNVCSGSAAAAVRVLFGGTEAAGIAVTGQDPTGRPRTVEVTGDMAAQWSASHLIEAVSVALAGNGSLPAIDTSALPVWVYWEGSCPEWIEACRTTIRRHAPNLRVVGRAEFEALRETDRDIDLSGLHVAHRADFVRAYLLHRHGGLWLDADCIVMQPLAPVLALLSSYDFVGHRERDGYVSNAFMAARPGSIIARTFYQTVAARLRAKTPLDWIALGNAPLTRILNATAARWLELPVERIQPICWSRPEAFFATGTPAEHARSFRDQAYCYMLSNQNVERHQRVNPAHSLTREDTLFSYLLRAAETPPGELRPDGEVTASARVGSPADEQVQIFQQMHVRHAREGFASSSGPGSTLEQTHEVRARLPLLLQHLGAESVLDLACGDYFWQRHTAFGVKRYIGTDVLDSIVEANRARFEDGQRRFITRDARTETLPSCDVVLCRDYLVHLSFADIVRVLENIIASGARYLIATSFTGRRSNIDISNGQWRPLNLSAPPFRLPAPAYVINEKCTESAGAFADKSLGIWRVADLQAPDISIAG